MDQIVAAYAWRKPKTRFMTSSVIFEPGPSKNSVNRQNLLSRSCSFSERLVLLNAPIRIGVLLSPATLAIFYRPVVNSDEEIHRDWRPGFR
jgi:hypothetical protein